jgi:glycosyltransferase involved in cell wall biosynthesis
MGLEELIQAIGLAARLCPGILLLIAGDGYLKATLQHLIVRERLERNVLLLGFVPEESLPVYYEAADIFVLPTQKLEGFGLSTIESLACGTPVLGTPVGATPEVLSALEPQLLFSDSTPSAMAEGILAWREQGVSELLRKKCREYCVENFSSEGIVQELLGVFSEVCCGA